MKLNTFTLMKKFSNNTLSVNPFKGTGTGVSIHNTPFFFNKSIQNILTVQPILPDNGKDRLMPNKLTQQRIQNINKTTPIVFYNKNYEDTNQQNKDIVNLKDVSFLDEAGPEKEAFYKMIKYHPYLLTEIEKKKPEGIYFAPVSKEGIKSTTGLHNVNNPLLGGQIIHGRNKRYNSVIIPYNIDQITPKYSPYYANETQNLLHELKHIEQFNKMSDKEMDEFSVKPDDEYNYANDPIEVEARKFATEKEIEMYPHQKEYLEAKHVNEENFVHGEPNTFSNKDLQKLIHKGSEQQEKDLPEKIVQGIELLDNPEKDKTSNSKQYVVDGKKVIFKTNSSYPKISILKQVYEKADDDRKIPVVVETKEQYLKEYITNQEKKKGIKFTPEQKKEYIETELQDMAPIVSRYTTKHNRFMEPRVVIFSDIRLKDGQLVDTLWHEFGHEVWERNPKIKRDWKAVNKDTSPTEYGKTDKEEDFADSYALARRKALDDKKRLAIIKKDETSLPKKDEFSTAVKSGYIQGKRYGVYWACPKCGKEYDKHFETDFYEHLRTEHGLDKDIEGKDNLYVREDDLQRPYQERYVNPDIDLEDEKRPNMEIVVDKRQKFSPMSVPSVDDVAYYFETMPVEYAKAASRVHLKPYDVGDSLTAAATYNEGSKTIKIFPSKSIKRLREYEKNYPESEDYAAYKKHVGSSIPQLITHEVGHGIDANYSDVTNEFKEKFPLFTTPTMYPLNKKAESYMENIGNPNQKQISSDKGKDEDVAESFGVWHKDIGSYHRVNPTADVEGRMQFFDEKLTPQFKHGKTPRQLYEETRTPQYYVDKQVKDLDTKSNKESDEYYMREYEKIKKAQEATGTKQWSLDNNFRRNLTPVVSKQEKVNAPISSVFDLVRRNYYDKNNDEYDEDDEEENYYNELDILEEELEILQDDKTSNNMAVRQKPQAMESYVDPYIKPILKRINNQGLITCASCSGISKDHNKSRAKPYLNVNLPEDVAVPGGSSIFDIKKINKPKEVQRYINAGERAGWESKPIKFMMYQPVIRFGEPMGGSIEVQEKIESDPRHIDIQKRLSDDLGNTEDFFIAIKERDKLEEDLLKKHKGHKWTDKEKKENWQKLEKELVEESEKPEVVEQTELVEEEIPSEDTTSDNAILYHGTSKENYERIKKHGLKTYPNYWGQDAVFLTPNKHDAAYYAKKGKGVVLNVYVPDEEIARLGHDITPTHTPKQIRLFRNIAPEHITVKG